MFFRVNVNRRKLLQRILHRSDLINASLKETIALKISLNVEVNVNH